MLLRDVEVGNQSKKNYMECSFGTKVIAKVEESST